MAEEKRRFSFTNLYRRSTPKPADRTVFNMGIQERENTHMMTGPLLYNIMNQSVIGRTCTTQLKQEVFRRGYVWEKAYEARCNDCGKQCTRRGWDLDHVKPLMEQKGLKVKDLNWSYYGLDNMQTLCKPCHKEKTKQDRKNNA